MSEKLPPIDGSVLTRMDAIAPTWAQLFGPGKFLHQPVGEPLDPDGKLVLAFGMMDDPEPAHALTIGRYGVGPESMLPFAYHSSLILQHPPIESHSRYAGDYEWAYLHALWTDEGARGNGFGSMNVFFLDKLLAKRAELSGKTVLAFGVDASGTGWSEAILTVLGFQNARNAPFSELKAAGEQLRFFKAYGQ